MSDLKNVIRTAIQEISIAMVRATVLSTNYRMQSVIVCEEGHVENLWNTIKYFEDLEISKTMKFRL